MSTKTRFEKEAKGNSEMVYSQHLLTAFTVRRARLWPPNNKVDSHVSLQSLKGFNLNTVAWVVELTLLRAIVKCESLWAGHCKSRCTVTQSKLCLIVTLRLT